MVWIPGISLWIWKGLLLKDIGIPLKSQATNLPWIDDVRNFTSHTLKLYIPPWNELRKPLKNRPFATKGKGLPLLSLFRAPVMLNPTIHHQAPTAWNPHKRDRAFRWDYVGVSKNRGTPKWMVYKTLLKWMIWGETHYFRKHPCGTKTSCMFSLSYGKNPCIFPWPRHFCVRTCLLKSSLKIIQEKQADIHLGREHRMRAWMKLSTPWDGNMQFACEQFSVIFFIARTQN